MPGTATIRERMAARSWYHKVDVGAGQTTPGLDFDHLWDWIRTLRRQVNYTGRRVVDLGSWDGMWAFEAEELGAAFVAATDIHPYAYENFLLCREALSSGVQPFYNTSVYDLRTNLAPIIYDGNARQNIGKGLFDIIQNFGLMYHVRDPMYALAACRSVLKTGGAMIIETAAILDDPASFMVLNGYPNEPRIYKDPTTWWAMTVSCLEEMLAATLFKCRTETIQVLHQGEVEGRAIGRVGLIADAVGPEDIPGLPDTLIDEFLQPYRSPGASLDHFRR